MENLEKDNLALQAEIQLLQARLEGAEGQIRVLIMNYDRIANTVVRLRIDNGVYLHNQVADPVQGKFPSFSLWHWLTSVLTRLPTP